jgi:O-methyltransferase
MSSEFALKRWLKRSRAIHASYKWSKMATQVSLSEWMRLHRTASILRVLPNTMLPARRLFNAYDLVLAVEKEGLPGSIAECGVWSGGGIGLMALASRRAGNRSRRFHLFDSFEGLPQPSPEDQDVLAEFRTKHPDVPLDDAGTASALQSIGACVGADAPAVRDFLTKGLKIEPSQLVFHIGWFQETVLAARDTIGPLAILRIDGDWYESTKVCLENLYDRVVDRGFIIVDDYGTFMGCRKAVDELASTRGINATRFVSVDDECIYFRK